MERKGMNVRDGGRERWRTRMNGSSECEAEEKGGKMEGKLEEKRD